MLRRFLTHLFGQSDQRSTAKSHHPEGTKAQPQRNPFYQIAKNTPKLAEFSDEETNCTRSSSDSLGNYLMRCTLAFISGRNNQALPQLLEEEINNLTCDKLNLLDQEFRKNFQWRTLDKLNEELLFSLKNSTSPSPICTVCLMWPGGYVREAAILNIEGNSNFLTLNC